MRREIKIMNFEYLVGHGGQQNDNAVKKTKANIEDRAVLGGEVLHGFVKEVSDEVNVADDWEGRRVQRVATSASCWLVEK